MTDTKCAVECKFCGDELSQEEIRDYRDLCGNCYGDLCYCKICDEEFLLDNECRHIFWWECVIWGCGSAEVEAESHKESFLVCLDKIGIDATKALVRSLRKQNYKMQYQGSLLGPTSLWMWWDGGEWGQLFTRESFAYDAADDLTPELEEKMTLGVGWLMSLWPGETEKAEMLTIRWAKEWLKGKAK